MTRLLFRCYLRRSGREPKKWVAHCIDLDLWASGSAVSEVQKSLEDAIVGYVQTVFDAEDRASIPALLRRRAPWRYVLLWYAIGLLEHIRRDGRTPLNGQHYEFTPEFQLGHA